jgi:hypothetical protein
MPVSKLIYPPRIVPARVVPMIAGTGVVGGANGNDSFAKLLLHCDGTDASTSFPDASGGGHTVTANGSAQVDTAQSVFGGASALFNGSGTNDYLSVPDSADFFFDTSDFTVDFRLRFSSIGANEGLIGQRADASNYWQWIIDTNLLRFLAVSGGTIRADYTVAHGLSATTWYHMALVRNGTSLLMFRDGTSLSLTTGTAISTNSVPNVAAALEIGRQNFNSANQYINGWMDEIRISKGIARWTTGFTPPSSAYS